MIDTLVNGREFKRGQIGMTPNGHRVFTDVLERTGQQWGDPKARNLQKPKLLQVRFLVKINN